MRLNFVVRTLDEEGRRRGVRILSPEKEGGCDLASDPRQSKACNERPGRCPFMARLSNRQGEGCGEEEGARETKVTITFR